MELLKLNKDWDAEPNAPMPKVSVSADTNNIFLEFFLNSFIHDNVDEEDLGVLEFINCYMYRLGPTNDEGFYKGQCRFSNSGVVWGDFYQIKDSNWQEDFPDDRIIVNSTINPNHLHHYLFYFRDETFECIAESYSFR